MAQVVEIPTPTQIPDLYREPDGSAATANWKTYEDKYFSFKHPTELEVRIQGSESQSKGMSVVYVRPGFNRPQSDLSDGYIFSVRYGSFIQAETLEKSLEKQQSQIKEVCPAASFSATKQTIVDGERALSYETKGCLGDYITTVTSRKNIAIIITQTYSGSVEQIIIYKKSLNQILSTFKFL